MSDLTENGNVWVYSMDASEINSNEYKDVVSRIPPNVLSQIRKDLVKACELACIPVLKESNGTDIFILTNKSFFIAINPRDLRITTYFIGDFGDVHKAGGEPAKETVENNVKATAVFYTWMFGKKFEFPEKYKHLEKEMVMGNDLDKILEYRGY